MQAPGHLHQQQIAHIVAQGVVERLELIQINEQQRPVVARALTQHHGLLQAVEQQAPVGQAGERVIEREMADLFLGLLALADV